MAKHRGCVLLLACVFAGAGAVPQGCRSHQPAGFDAFTRNRLAVVVRSLESVRDAQSLALDQCTRTLRAIRQEAWTGAEPDAAYDNIRRMRATCESRAHSADLRLSRAEFQGEDYFAQWGRELEDYDDNDLRENARRERTEVLARYKATLRHVHEAQDAFAPVLAAIEDQVLYLKHHRGQPAVPPRPAPVIEPLSRADDLTSRTTIARIAIDDFIASVDRRR